MSTIPDFGQPAADYVPAEFDEDDVWILKFKVGETQIRICPATAFSVKENKDVFGTQAWPTEREHYDDATPIGAYPCAEPYGMACVGCAHTDKKVRERSRCYYINALDKDGKNRIFKMGVKLYKIFVGREQRALGRSPENVQPLSGRDFIVIRTGSGMSDTSYDPEPGDAYEVDFPEELHDIKEVLKSKYAAAVEFYEGGAPIKEPDVTGEAATGRITPAAKAASNGVAAAAESVPEDASPKWFTNPDPADLDDATSDELKRFLAKRELEFPPRAARSRLLALAQEAIKPPF